MPERTHQFAAPLLIPDYLVSEVQSKLAYVDEDILQAHIDPAGEGITLHLRRSLDGPALAALEEKTNRVVLSMVKGAFQPKVQVSPFITGK